MFKRFLKSRFSFYTWRYQQIPVLIGGVVPCYIQSLFRLILSDFYLGRPFVFISRDATEINDFLLLHSFQR